MVTAIPIELAYVLAELMFLSYVAATAKYPRPIRGTPVILFARRRSCSISASSAGAVIVHYGVNPSSTHERGDSDVSQRIPAISTKSTCTNNRPATYLKRAVQPFRDFDSGPRTHVPGLAAPSVQQYVVSTSFAAIASDDDDRGSCVQSSS